MNKTYQVQLAIRSLHLHKLISTRLELCGFDAAAASKEAARRMKQLNFQFDDWKEYMCPDEIKYLD